MRLTALAFDDEGEPITFVRLRVALAPYGITANVSTGAKILLTPYYHNHPPASLRCNQLDGVSMSASVAMIRTLLGDPPDPSAYGSGDDEWLDNVTQAED